MKRPLVRWIAGLALAGAAGAAFGTERPALVDGMPCVEEVCVGDATPSLTEIPWQPALNPANDVPLSDSRVSDTELERLDGLLSGPDDAVRALAPYWLMHRFDGVALAALAGIHAVCAPLHVGERLSGTYLSRGGLRTVVDIEPVPDPHGAHFVVVSIAQYADPAASGADLKRLGADIKARYAGLPRFPSVDRPGGGWVAHAATGPHLRLLAPWGDSLKRSRAFAEAPDCSAPEPSAESARP